MSEIPQPGGRLTMLLPRQLLRYPKRWALLLIWVPIIGFLVLRSTFLYTHFQDLIKTHLREMDANLSNLVQVSAEHALRTFSAADQTLRFVIHQYRAGGPQLNLRTLVDDGTIDASLVTQAGIINAQGVLQQSSLDKGVLVNLSDRQVFKVHASADTGTVYISEPVLARADGKWAIQLSRRINHPDGRFAGVAFVAIAPQYFNGFYSALNLPSDSVLSLSGLDGITRARHWNEQSSFGDNISRDPFIQQIGSGVSSGMYTAHDALDGVERRFAFRKIEGYPLAISAGLAVQSMAAALEQAKQLMRLQATLAATAVLLIGVVLSVIYLQMHKALGDRKLAVANLREREDRLKFAMTAGGLSAWELNLANLADSPYEGVVRLLGYAPGQEDMANFSPQHFLTLMSRDKTGQISEAWTDLTSERSERMTLPLSLINQQGNRVWIEVLVQVTQWGPDGAPLRLSGLAHDVTRAKDTADAIQNSLNQWQIAISGTGSGIWDWDIQSQKLFLSDSVFTSMTYLALSNLKISTTST